MDSPPSLQGAEEAKIRAMQAQANIFLVRLFVCLFVCLFVGLASIPARGAELSKGIAHIIVVDSYRIST